jgi:hypothetical protein
MDQKHQWYAPRNISLLLKIFSVVYVVVMFTLGQVFGWRTSAQELITIGAFIAAAFLPVDLSMIARNATHDNTLHKE